MKTLIVDATNLAYRAKYAYQLEHLGYDVSVTFGVTKMLTALVIKHKPTSVIMCWDKGLPAYRRKLDPLYKTQRDRSNDPTYQYFIDQTAELEEILPYFGVLSVGRCGIEADDLVYQASRLVSGQKVIVTTDADLYQAVNDYTIVYNPIKNIYIHPETFYEQTLFTIEEYVVAKALIGDVSDNIKGLKYVGPRFAREILNKAKLEKGVGYEDCSEIVFPRIKIDTKGLRNYVKTGAYERAYKIFDLAPDRTGARQVIYSTPWHPFDKKKAYDWCMQKGFASLLIEGQSLAITFNRLRRPYIEPNGYRFPRIWDYERKEEL